MLSPRISTQLPRLLHLSAIHPAISPARSHYSMVPDTLSVADIATLPALYKSKSIHASTTNPKSPYIDHISLIKHDITRLSVSCIVNAANSKLLGGGGVDGAIHRAAGPELLSACQPLHGCKTGSAKITPAFRLSAKHVVHAVGPVYDSVRAAESERLLRGAYRASLDLARDHGCESIAFSTISTGVYGYPIELATEVVLDEVRNWLSQNEASVVQRIVFCVFSDEDEAVYLDTLPKYFPPGA